MKNLCCKNHFIFFYQIFTQLKDSSNFQNNFQDFQINSFFTFIETTIIQLSSRNLTQNFQNENFRPAQKWISIISVVKRGSLLPLLEGKKILFVFFCFFSKKKSSSAKDAAFLSPACYWCQQKHLQRRRSCVSLLRRLPSGA